MNFSTPSVQKSPMSMRTSSEVLQTPMTQRVAVPADVETFESLSAEIPIAEDENALKFSRIRQRLDSIMKYIESDRREKEERNSKKIDQIKEIETEMLNRVQTEMQANREMDKRLTFLVEQRTSDLRAQLAVESKKRIRSVEDVKRFTAEGISSLNDQFQQN